MNLRIKARTYFFSILMSYTCGLYAGFPNNNLFNPYDILLFKPMPQDSFFDLDVAYEGAFRVRAYQADPDDRLMDDEIPEERNLFRRRADPLQLWQNYQEFFSALEGTQNLTQQDTDARAFNIRQERLSGRLLPHGDLHVPVNLMFAARFALPFNLTLGFYLPFFMSELKNVRWEHIPTQRALRKKATFTGLLDHELDRLEKAGDIDLRNGWKRHGIGDLTALLWWWHDYPQAKQWLKNVRVGARGGLTFPTGDRGDIHKLFQLPFGHDGGVGILFGGTLELGFGRYVRLGIDGEFLQLFGSVKERRFMTDQRQTDLIFLNKRQLHVDPGFMQHYTLYLKTPFFCRWAFLNGCLPTYAAT